MLLRNAELRRYLWLSKSLPALLTPVIIIGLYVMLEYLSSGGQQRSYYGFNTGLPDHTQLLYICALAASALFLILIPCARALTEEISSNTWDFQRISGQSPLKILLGKWVGTSAYGWYTIACLIAGYTVLSILYDDFEYYLRFLMSLPSILAASAVALSLGFVAWRNTRIGGSATSWIAALFAAGYGLYLYFLSLALIFGEGMLAGRDGRVLGATVINWMGVTVPVTFLFLLATFLYTFWVLVAGLYALRQNMREPVGNNAVIAFLLFHAIFVGGFIALELEQIVAVTMLLAATYTVFALSALFYEDVSLNRYHRWAQLWRQGQGRAAFHYTPRWLLGMAAALLSYLVMFAVAYNGDNPRSIGGIMFVGTLFLFLFRDIALFHALVIFSASKRAGLYFFIGVACFYLLVMGMLPFPLNPIADIDNRQEMMWISALMHLGILLPVLLLLVWRWRRALSAPPVDGLPSR